MTDARKLKNAQNVYKSLCDMLDSRKFRYDKHPEDLVVTFTVQGEDIPMNFILMIDADRELVRLVSPIPLTFEPSKRVEAAIATSQINYRLADGNFELDLTTGKVLFKITSSFVDSLISQEIFEYMIGVSCHTVDDFNDKLLMLAKGLLPLDAFFKKN